MNLKPVEKGQMLYREQRGLPPKYHARLIHNGRTLAILQADSQDEAALRASRIADALSLAGATIEAA